MTEYLTRLVEEQPIKDFTGTTAMNFLFDYVLTQFGCANILMSDHGTHILNEMISMLAEEFQLYHHKITPYHPHANEMMEEFDTVSKDVLSKVPILKKLIGTYANP